MNDSRKNTRLVVRKVIFFISDTAIPYISKNFPRELVRPIINALIQIKEVCNEWLDKRGRFSESK